MIDFWCFDSLLTLSASSCAPVIATVVIDIAVEHSSNCLMTWVAAVYVWVG